MFSGRGRRGAVGGRMRSGCVIDALAARRPAPSPAIGADLAPGRLFSPVNASFGGLNAAPASARPARALWCPIRGPYPWIGGCYEGRRRGDHDAGSRDDSHRRHARRVGRRAKPSIRGGRRATSEALTCPTPATFGPERLRRRCRR
jgi:hypothetical protein